MCWYIFWQVCVLGLPASFDSVQQNACQYHYQLEMTLTIVDNISKLTFMCYMHFLTQLSQASSDLAQLQKQCQSQREETQRLEQQLQQLQLEQRRNPAANTVSWNLWLLGFHG